MNRDRHFLLSMPRFGSNVTFYNLGDRRTLGTGHCNRGPMGGRLNCLLGLYGTAVEPCFSAIFEGSRDCRCGDAREEQRRQRNQDWLGSHLLLPFPLRGEIFLREVIRCRRKKPSLFPTRVFSFRRDNERLWRWSGRMQHRTVKRPCATIARGCREPLPLCVPRLSQFGENSVTSTRAGRLGIRALAASPTTLRQINQRD
jgi:hypothetical protein